MSICNLEQQVDLRKSLEQYTNVLLLKEIKQKSFDYINITKKVNDAVFTKNKDQAQSLGIAYHVPQIILNLIDANPDISVTDINGLALEDLKKFVSRIAQTDGLDYLGAKIGVLQKSLEGIEKEIADQSKDPDVPIVTTSSIKDVAIDELIFPDFTLKGTGQQLLEDPGSLLPSMNETASEKNFYYETILLNILNSSKGDETDFTDVTYSNHTGFRLLAMRADKLPNPNKNSYLNLTDDTVILAVTDNKGNFLYFNDKGEIVPEAEGKIAYFTMEKLTKEDIDIRANKLKKESLEEITNQVNQDNSIPDTDKNAVITERTIQANKYIDKKMKLIEEQVLNIAIDAKADVTRLMDITGGKKGSYLNTDEIKDTARKKAVEKPLSMFNLTQEEKESIQFKIEKKGSQSRTTPAIYFKKYDTSVSLKNPNKLATDSEVLNNIVDVLIEDLKEFGITVPMSDKISYVKQFINIDSNPTVVITNSGIFINGKQLSLENKEAAKQELKTALGGFYVSFMKKPYADNSYEWITISNGDVIRESKPYYDFIFKRFVPRVAMDITENRKGRPVIVNGYFTFRPANEEFQVKERVKQTIEEVKQDQDLQLKQLDADDIIFRSKLIDTIPTTKSQEKRAEKFLNEHPIFNAVDENGRPLLTKDFARSIVNSDAFASFSNATVTLYEGASFTHGYHEAWHVFSQMYLSKAERDNLYKAAAKLSGSFDVVKKSGTPGGNNIEKVTVKFSELDPTKSEDRLLLEEFIAEEFRIFAINKGKFKTKSTKTNVFAKIFNRVWQLLKNLFGVKTVYSNPESKSVLDEMFNVLYKAKKPQDISKFMPSMEKAEFGTLNSGVINEEGKEVFTYQEAMLLSASIDGIISLATNNFIKAGAEEGQVRNGFVLTAITKAINQRRLYNVVVKDAFEQKLRQYAKYVKDHGDKPKTDLINEYIKNIDLLTRALDEKNFGSIADIQEGKATDNSLVAFHKENTVYKDLFTETDYDIEIDETDSQSMEKSKRVDNKSGNERKTEDEATKETLFLVKSLLKQDDNNKYVYNSLGFPETVDFITTWRVLTDKLGGATTIAGLYNNMIQASQMNIAPYFDQLLLKVGNPDVTMPASEDASKLWIGLYQSFCLYKMPLMITQYTEELDENGNLGVKIRVGRATADYYKIKKRDWPSRFAQSTSNFVITDPKTKVNSLNLPAIKKAFIKKSYNKNGIPVYTVDRNNWIPFLNSIGLYLSDNIDIKQNLKEENVIYLIQAIGLAEENNMVIDNPVDFFSKNQKFKVKKLDGTEEKINYNSSVGAIDTIASLEAQHSIIYATQMHKGASGNLKNTNSLNSTYTKIINSLNEVTRKGQMFDETLTGDYQHMYYLNPEYNPQAAANTIINSLFNSDGTKNLNNSIIVFDIDGAVYTTEDGEAFGVAYGKMDPLDKVITDITSMLFYGVVEATSRAGEKKSYHGIKVNEIKTYADKKSKHLYVDIEPFLRNQNGDRLVNNNINIKLLNILYPKLEAELKRIKMIKDDADYYKTYKGFEKAAKFSAFADVLEQTAKKGESLKERLTTDDFLEEVSKKGLLTILRENTDLRDELNMQMLTYFKNLKERNEKHYIKSTNLSYEGEAVLPEALIENFKSMFQDKNRYGITKEQMAELGPYTNKAIKDAVFSAYVVNTWLYHHDMGSIIHTDFFQFNHEKNEGTKRISPYQSPGNIFATDRYAKVHIDNYVKRPYEQKLIDAGTIKPKEVRKFNGKLNTAIIRESVVRSEYYEMYEEMFRTSMKNRGLSEKQIKIELYGKNGLDKNGNPTGGRMAPYAKIKDADGQGLISFDTYRILKNLESDWSPAQEQAYKRIIDGENLSPEEIQDFFPVYKLGMAGPLAITKKYPINSIHKFSLFPLIPNVIKGKVYEELHKKMIAQDTDYIVFETGSKQSHITASTDGKGDEIFETLPNGTSDTSRLKSDFTFTKNPIFIAYLKNQTKVNSYYKKSATLASQLRKLFNVGLYSEGKPINKRAEEKTNKVFDIIDRLTDTKKKEILRKLQWTEVKDPNNPKKTILQGDINTMLTFIKKELKKQGFPQEQIDYIDTDSNGAVDISTHPAAPQIEKLLLSIINNQIVRLKINGEPLVEVSSALSQDINFKKPTKKDLETYGTNGIKSYVVDAKGKKDTKGMGVKVALSEGYQKLFYTKYFTKDEKGKYVDSGETIAVYKKDKNGKNVLDFDASFDRLNEMLLVDSWLNTDNNRLKIRITGVRIPVQGPNSAEFAEVQQFLPPSAGAIIIIPAEVVAKSGTDFDVDKLTTYLKYISSRGTLFEDKYDTVEELEEHIKKLESRFDKEKLKGIKGDLATVIKEKDLMWLDIKDSLSDFRKAIQDVADTKYIGKEQYNKLTSKDNMKLLETLKTDKMQAFVKKTAPEAYKIFKSKIKNFNEKEYPAISDVIDNLYKQKDALSKLALEISLAKEHKRNFSKVIENNLIDAIVDVLAMPEMAEALLTPNDTHLTKYLTEDEDNQEGLKSLIQRLDDKTNFEKSIMTGERNEAKGISPTRMLEQDYNTEKQQDNISGGQGLGIVAVAGTNSNLFRMIGAKMNATMPVATVSYNKDLKKKVEEIRDVPLDMKLNYNKTKDGAISLAHVRDTNNINSVAEIISQLLNGFVDIGKDEWVTYLQGNPTVIPKILFLIDAGVPFEEIAYFISNPMIREYVRLEKGYGSNLSKVIYGPTHDPSKAKQKAKNEFLDTIVLPKEINEVFKNNKYNIYGLRTALNHYAPVDKFSMDFLKSVAKTKLDFKDNNQKAGFIQYLLLEELIKDYDKVKMVMNPDTNTSPNLLEAKIKMNEISGLKNSPTLDPKMIEDLKNVGALRPFQVQDFALTLFGPLFPTRNHPKLVEFLLNTVEDYNERSSIEKATGLDAYKFSIKLQNSLYEYIFSNKIKKYRLGQETYNQIAVDSLIDMDTVVADFNNKTYADTNAYLSRGLYPINIAAFADSSVEEFIGFSLEREYLRRNFPIDVAKESKEFRIKYKQLRGLERFKSLSNDNVANIAYESYLASNALKNTYNTYKLFRSGKDTIASELMDIIESYPALSKSFPILTKFKSEVVPNDAQKSYKGYVNFTLIDKNDMDEKKAADYKKQLADLADPSIIKIANNPETNQYISNFFRYLPIYSFLQSGMNASAFNLMEIMPNSDYKRIMDSASVALKALLDDERGMDFLKGFKELFKKVYSTKNSKILNRGANWKKSASEVIALKDRNALNIENLSYAIEKSHNVYLIDDSLIAFKEATKKYSGAQNPRGELLRDIKNANSGAIYISSLKDLVKNFPGLNFSNLENAKVSIDNALKYTKDLVDSGKTLIFTTDIFDIKPESLVEATETTTKPTQTTVSGTNDLAEYTNHSGGAAGSDTAWDEIGKKFGMVENKHYYTGVKGPKNAPLGNVDITDKPIAVEGATKVAQAAKQMWGYKYKTMKDQRLIRNWAQVANSDTVFAIGTLGKEGDIWKGDEKSAEPRRLLKVAVQGGTGYAVEMAIQAGKPVYVFDQVRNQWYKNIDGQWSKSEVPTLTKNFAGIGTREINEAGKQAIRDVYANTIKSTQPSTTVKGINIKTDKNNPNSLGNRLTNPNWYSKGLMDVEGPYKAGASKKTAPSLNMEEALKYDMNLMYKLQVEKFRKNPELIDEINAQGGLDFIKASSHEVGVKNSRWEGKGMESNFIKVLAQSYTTVAKELGKFIGSTQQAAPVAKPTVEVSEALPNDTYQYYGAMHEIVRDAQGNGIDVVGYKGKTAKKLALLEKYNENPDIDPQNKEYFRNKPEVKAPDTTSDKLEGDSILDMRTNMIDYTSKQRKALLEIEKLIDSNKQAYYLLAGYAGTGKTTIAENIAKYAIASKKEVRILAPTNKAAKVLKDKFRKAKVSSSATTIHKAIYGTPDPITGEWITNTQKIKDSVVIVDESSMISKDLMSDLLDKTDDNNVVIFMGDGFQLEAVGQDSGLFQDKIPQVKQKSELTEVKRQSLDSNILKVATLVRTDNKGYIPETSYEDFKVTKNKANFIQQYKESIRNNEDTVMIVATNAERILMNNIARTEKFGKDSAVLNADDTLISVANSATYPNSETFKVSEIINTTGPKKFTMQDKMGKSSSYDVYFSQVITGDGESVTVMHIPELDKPSLYHAQIGENASSEIMNYLSKNDLVSKRGKVSSSLVIATYGYAVTAHKSQGSQWSKVFVNQNYVAPTWNAARWYYTAITRAADEVVVFSSNNNVQISNEEIEKKINQLVEDSDIQEKTAKLKDGKVYKASQINSKMLESMGYTPEEIGKILKQIC